MKRKDVCVTLGACAMLSLLLLHDTVIVSPPNALMSPFRNAESNSEHPMEPVHETAPPASPHRHPKYFHEPRGHHHVDARYFKNVTLPASKIRRRLRTLMALWDAYCKLPWWMAYGTLLGAWREKDVISWDNDLDISMLRADLLQMPAKDTLARDVIFERNPYASDPSLEDRSNSVDARVVCTQTGLFIDVFAYAITRNTSVVYFNKAGDTGLFYSDIFPLTRLRLGRASFPAPHLTEEVLLRWYGDLDPDHDVSGVESEVTEVTEGSSVEESTVPPIA